MSTRTIMWTALPNGFAPAGRTLLLSVLVSPRLVTNNGSEGLLSEFTDFLDWPQTVRGLSFRVEFQGGPAFTVTPNASTIGALDSAAWRALFHADTMVRSFAFADKSGVNVLSFPTKRILAFVKQAYQTLAVNSPQAKPTLQQLGLGPNSRRFGVGELALDRRALETVQGELRTWLGRYHAVPPGIGNPAFDFYQMQVMHQPLSKEVLDENRHRLPLPPLAPPTLDFHQGVAALGQYPRLERTLGIVIDLEVPLERVPAASNLRVTPSLGGRAPAMNMTPWTAYRFDAAKRLFSTADAPGSDVANGMLLLAGADQYDVTEVDIDGAASKLQDFATNLARMGSSGNTSIDTPVRYGVPSLRSAGFSASRAGRALRLVATFQRAKANNASITQAQPVVLHAEDLTRGYRVDVWNSASGQWHSLCLRNGTYRFTAGTLTRTIADEGFVTLATTQSADGSSTDLRLPESLFRWRGWSLSAPRPGRTIGTDSMPADAGNPAATQLQLETSFTVQKGTLPRLRFGARYQFRARAVDLAGNSLAPDAPIDDIYSLPPQPLPYLRYEPVPSPVIVALGEFGMASPGESTERWVIRSNYDTHIAAVSERHLAAPKTTVDLAETHGMLDTPAGPPDPDKYSLIVGRDGAFADTMAHPEPQLRLPYLPDPFAAGAALRALPGTDAVQKIAFSYAWPDKLPFRLRLDEGNAPPAFVETEAERVLTVHLPKAQVLEIALSSYFADAAALEQMAIWSWIAEAAPPNLAELQQLALDGGHWMLTPPRTITLVHAVRQPLIEPQWQAVKAVKRLGETYATIVDEIPISGPSTEKLDIEARWQETVDDGSDRPQPVLSDAAARAFEVALTRDNRAAAIKGLHEFHDTRHRMVDYTVRATTRFRDYFPPDVTGDIENISRVSLPVTVSVPSSARPDAPKPLYVIPTFRWTGQTEGSWNFSRRQGGGLRVYLDRPWFSSGEGELLGVVLWGCPPPEHNTFNPFVVPDFLNGYVTQWGRDPLWAGLAPPSQAVPRREHFRNAVAFADALSLEELANRPGVSLSVAGHAVAFDPERKLWYCDIELDPGNAYFPFIRLALARYQPDSVPDAHLSRVVLAEFAQLMPDRSASITLDPLDLAKLELAVTGLTYAGPGTASVRATLQTQPADADGELAWVPVSVTPLAAYLGSGPDTLWTASLTLPAPCGSRPFRLLIEEFETYAVDVSGGKTQTRLVYADYMNLA